MKKLQDVYKNAVSLTYKDENIISIDNADIPSIEAPEPLDMISSFLLFPDVGPDEKRQT